MNAVTTTNENQTTGMMPRNMTEVMQMSDMLAKSEIVPKDFKGKPGNILVAIQWGIEVGLPPLQSLQNIAVINGRPAMWGDAVLALVQGSGKLEYIDETVQDGVAVCRVKRRGQPEQIRTFSEDDAKKANLLGKAGPWSQYPKRMMQMRARAFALRDVFADVLKGISVAEEVQDIVETPELAKVEIQPKPQPKPEPLDRVVGNMLMEHCGGDVAAMKQFVIESLEWPPDTELKGKWMQSLEEGELLTVKERIESLTEKA